MKHVILVAIILTACGSERGKVKDETATGVQMLRSKYQAELTRASALRDAETGWIDRMGCDAMIWTGKYAAADGVTGVAVEAAQYPAPGKWGRRPPPWCWTPAAGDQGSKTEWSRDMAIAGLLPWAWRTARLDVVQSHISYGKANNWRMGDPLADGRTVYTPALIGILHKMQFALGGELKSDALWPDVYPSGLDDYQAHLQVMSIWLQGEIATVLKDDAARPRPGTDLVSTTAMSISESMYARLAEHANREATCPLFLTVHGIYSGSMQPAVDALLGDTWSCQYLRCTDLEQCRLADWLFTASLALEALP